MADLTTLIDEDFDNGRKFEIWEGYRPPFSQRDFGTESGKPFKDADGRGVDQYVADRYNASSQVDKIAQTQLYYWRRAAARAMPDLAAKNQAVIESAAREAMATYLSDVQGGQGPLSMAAAEKTFRARLQETTTGYGFPYVEPGPTGALPAAGKTYTIEGPTFSPNGAAVPDPTAGSQVKTTVESEVPQSTGAPPPTSGAYGTDPAAGAAPAVPGASVTPGDSAEALNAYREAIKRSTAQYDGILNHSPTPAPASVVKPIASVVDPSKTAQAQETNVALNQVRKTTAAVADPNDIARARAATLDPNAAFQAAGPGPLAAAQATAAGVGRTTLDEGPQAEARRLQLANVSRLTEAAEGRGPAADAARARVALALKTANDNALGVANQARGAERGSIRRQVALKGSSDSITAALGLEAQAAADRMTSQNALSGAIAGTRTADVDVAGQKAKLEADRNALMAQLQTAVAQGNRDAENAIRMKVADLTTQINTFNAQQKNTLQGQNLTNLQRSSEADAAAGNDVRARNQTNTQAANTATAAATNDTLNQNATRSTNTAQFNTGQQNTTQARADQQGFDAQNLNNQTGLDVSRLTEEQRVANERLKLDASKAAQDAARGLLDERQRAETNDMARRELELANKRFQLSKTESERAAAQADRDFWMKVIASVAQGATAVIGGAITSDVRSKENIKPVSSRDLAAFARAARASFSTYTYKEGHGLPEGEQASPMAQALEKTNLGKKVVFDDGGPFKKVDVVKLNMFLAMANSEARKKKN